MAIRETKYSTMILVSLLIALFLISTVESKSIISDPQPAPTSFIINTTTAQSDNAGTCSFTVRFTTSCSSPRYTRDQISVSFGDAYGNQVYAPRIEDPRSRAFEACSVDTYDLRGPCTYDICYLYVYRSGYDGWKLSTVEVYGHNIRPVSFRYNAYVPNDVWWGYDYCQRASASA